MASKLKLSPAARRGFADIVGERWITDDPAHLSAYAWVSSVGKVGGPNKFASVWPIAAVLPQTVEEVAAVVRHCVSHKLCYKAHSTGYGSMGNASTPDTVIIDLRRIRSIEIDAKNRMAIVSPYVTAGMLQAEALKHGLTCHIVGAGQAHSPLASATSLIGVGITSQGTSINVRNLLAWEWVSPTGEIVRGGSAGAGCGWFSGDGPGPGLRGLLRGTFGAGGGLGVFTRMGYKLYPIPARTQPTTGSLPQLGLDLPEHAGLYQVAWPDWESLRAATFELIEETLCFAILRMPPDHIGWTLTATNADYVRQVESGTLSPAARPENDKNWTLLTLSASAAEQAWRDGVITDIVSRTGGRFVEVDDNDRRVLYRNLLTSQFVPRVLRPSGGITTSFGVFDSMQFIPEAMKAGEKALAGETNRGGRLVEGGTEAYWSWPIENRYLWAENIIDFNPADRNARVAAARALLDHFAISFKTPVGVLALGVGPIMELQGEEIGAPQRYIRAFKKALDAADASRSNEYVITNMPRPIEVALPKLRPLILSSPMLGLLSRIIGKHGM